MNTQAIEYIKENQNLLYRYCRKLTKDDNTAWDLLQNTYLFFMKNETVIENVHIYVMSAINGRFINSRRGKTQFHNRFYKELTSNVKNRLVEDVTPFDELSEKRESERNKKLIAKFLSRCSARQVLAVNEYFRLGDFSKSPHFKCKNTFKATYLQAVRRMEQIRNISV